MSQNRKKLKKNQKKKLGKIFFRVMLSTFIVIGILFAGLWFAYNHFIYKGDGQGGIMGGTLGGSKKEPDKINKTLAVLGVDEDGYRTDVIFVVNYNSETGKAKVISIPRDTKIEWSEDQRRRMEELKGYSRSESKINEMTSYVGIEHVRDFTIDEIENMLDIQVDNYVLVTIDAFKQIVDAIGGVDVDVPVLDGDGLQYDDNSAGLHIHLDPGMQHLDGELAEGLVRFRKGYSEGDVGRIKTQQIFLEAFAKKMTSPAIIPSLPGIVNTVFNTVTTDVKLTEIPGYLPYLQSLDSSQVAFNIIPGEPDYQNGKSYFIADEAAIPSFVQGIFNEETVNDTPIVEDKTVSIEVLNAAGIKGAAASEKEKLEVAGYTVESIGNTTLDDTSTTIINAKDTEKGRQFQAFYPNAVIKQQEDLSYDIQIILGDDIQ